MKFDFSGQVFIVTGAAGNLGTALARQLATENAHIALVDLNDEALKQTAEGLDGSGTVIEIPTNLIDPDSVAAMVETVLEKFGKIDTLCNIAGGFRMGPLVQDTADKDWNFMMDLNARTVFNTCRAAIPSMLEHGSGRIINISARAAENGKGKMGPYCASKAAVWTLTESLAAENKFNNINVNCILPGTIDTPQNRSDMPDADFAKWVPPSALADVIMFLASDAARCVTGAAIPVYGQS